MQQSCARPSESSKQGALLSADVIETQASTEGTWTSDAEHVSETWPAIEDTLGVPLVEAPSAAFGLKPITPNFGVFGVASDNVLLRNNSEILQQPACPSSFGQPTLNRSTTTSSSVHYSAPSTAFNDIAFFSHESDLPKNLNLAIFNSSSDSILPSIDPTDCLSGRLQNFDAEDNLMSAWIDQWANPAINERGFANSAGPRPINFAHGLSLESTHMGSKDSSSVSDPDCCTTSSTRVVSSVPQSEMSFPFHSSRTTRNVSPKSSFASRQPFLKLSGVDPFTSNKETVKDEFTPQDRSNRFAAVSRAAPRNFPFFDSKHLPTSSKRWQNLNVVLPLFLPYGTVVVTKPCGENTYVFPDNFPSAQLLFSSAGRVCDVWASMLRLRVAVVHKCPEFLVPRLVEMFNSALSGMVGIFSEPLTFRCMGLLRHSIHMRSAGSSSYRYDTVAQLPDPSEHAKLLTIFAHLQRLQKLVHTTLRQEAEAVFGALEVNGGLAPASDVYDPETRRCSLEFRFSPCREFKVAVREGTPCECGGLDGVLSGGGASSLSTWSQQITVDGVVASELRLERDKSQDLESDPMYSSSLNVMSRAMSKDPLRNPGRVVFCDLASLDAPGALPRVELAHGMSAFAAGRALCGSTYEPLAAWLPRGLRSLTDGASHEEGSHRNSTSCAPSSWQVDHSGRHSTSDLRLPIPCFDERLATNNASSFFGGGLDSSEQWSGRSADCSTGRGWLTSFPLRYPQGFEADNRKCPDSNDLWSVTPSMFWNPAVEHDPNVLFSASELFSSVGWTDPKIGDKSVVLEAGRRQYAPS